MIDYKEKPEWLVKAEALKLNVCASDEVRPGWQAQVKDAKGMVNYFWNGYDWIRQDD